MKLLQLRGRNYIHILKRLCSRIQDVVPGRRRNIDKRWSYERLPSLAVDQRLALPMQDYQRLLVLAGRVPADRLARLQAHKAAAHSRRLRNPVQQRTILLSAFERHIQGLRFHRLR